MTEIGVFFSILFIEFPRCGIKWKKWIKFKKYAGFGEAEKISIELDDDNFHWKLDWRAKIIIIFSGYERFPHFCNIYLKAGC